MRPEITDTDDLIACPGCDALYRVRIPEHGQRAICSRCHTVLVAPRRRAGMTIVMLSLGVLILVFGALWFPFLEISRSGFHNSATLIDSALAFTDGPLLILSLSVAGFIILIPLTRVMLILYVLWPVVFDRPPNKSAAIAFRLAESLRPWSMAEIFALGCAVALVKVADLAQIGFGPAFWMFAALVVIIAVQDNQMCRWSIWQSLDETDSQA
jgi:paraquat-inducible protein A